MNKRKGEYPKRSRTRTILRYVIKKHLRSEKYAWRGVTEIVRQQLNFQIELLAAFMVIVAGFLFQIDREEWMILGFTIVLVLVSEAFNSVIEAMSDAITKEHNENIRYAKDVAAGAVLISALLSLVIGIAIFGPYIKELLNNS